MTTRSLVVSALLAIAGCTSIPLTTMWKLRDCTVESFFAKDPTQLRVAIQREMQIRQQEQTEIALNITMPKVLEPAVDGAPFPLRIDLALDRVDGYFTLIKETTVEPARFRPDPAKPKLTCGTES